MKSTLFILAVLFGAALAEEGKSIEGKEEGRLIGPGTIVTLITVGTQIIILLALINFVTSLKGSIDFDNLFGKGGDGGYDDYSGYDTGYAAPATGYAQPATAGHGGGSSYTQYRREGNVAKRSFGSAPVMQALTDRVYKALESFNQ